MQEQSQEHGQCGAATEIVRRNATSSLLEAAVMLVVGFAFFNLPKLDEDATPAHYAWAIMVWTFRGGGLLMLGVSLLAYLGWPRAPFIDAVASIVLGLLLLISGGVLLVDKQQTGLLVVLFGLMSLYAARGSWGAYQSVLAAMGASPQAAEPSPARSPDGATRAEEDHGPSIGPEVQDEAPPEGFLAEFGESKDENETSR